MNKENKRKNGKKCEENIIQHTIKKEWRDENIQEWNRRKNNLTLYYRQNDNNLM